jgi:hypothetical protein
MHWALWETKGKNLVETFDTEDEALQGVREILAVNRPDFVEYLALGVMHDEGEPHEEELPPFLYGEALKARLAETAPVAEAQAVHERIRKWLVEEDWVVQDLPSMQEPFAVTAIPKDGQMVTVFQRKGHSDHITIGQRATFDDEFRSDFSQLPEDIQRKIVRDTRRDVMLAGVDFNGLDIPPVGMQFFSHVYFDGLTKDIFMKRVRLVLRALLLSVQTIERGFDEAGRPSERTASLMRLVS